MVADVEGLKYNESKLSLILNEKAGIIDDTIITKFPTYMHMIINAGNKHKDLKHMQFIKDEYFKNADLSI